MKKIILLALAWPLVQFYSPVHAQKNKSESKSREIIIMSNNDKDTKLTIETKNGETFINGKPASEYKDDGVSVITRKNRNGYSIAPNGTMNIFNDDGEKKAFLGVTTEKADNGVKIKSIEKGSTAEKAGLQEGDVITNIGSKKISDPDDLADAVTSYKPKDEIKISYSRNGKSDNLKATLGEHSQWRTFSYNTNNFVMPPMPKMAQSFKNFNYDFNTPAAPDRLFNLLRTGRQRLGLRIEDTENDSGATITNVEDGSAAATAGLKKDDIITDVNGKSVKNVNEVLEQIRNNNDKYSYTLKAKRNGANMSFEIKIPKKKNNADL